MSTPVDPHASEDKVTELDTPKENPFFSFLQSSIRNRLMAIVIGAAIIPVLLTSIILGIATYTQMRSALVKDTFDKLDAVEAIKVGQMESFLVERQNDMDALNKTMGSLLIEALSKLETINQLKHNELIRLHISWDTGVRDMATNPGVVQGVVDLSLGLQTLGTGQARSLYLGQDELINAGDGSDYSVAHASKHEIFSEYIDLHEYDNFFLIDPAGNIVYSAIKGDSFGTNLVTGPYQATNLASLYHTLLSGEFGKSYFADFADFDNKQALFIGTPIYKGSTLRGMLVFQIPTSQINAIINNRTGLGNTGETFLIAQEIDERITIRSDRSIIGGGKFIVGYDVSSIAPQFMYDALAGITGSDLSIGGSGASAITAYSPLSVEGLNWAILTRIDGEEVLVPSRADGEDFLTLYAELYDYRDVFLIHPNGDIFYTVAKEADYHTNILNGEYSDTNLGTLINEVIESGETLLTDIAHYAPSGGDPAMFFGSPLFDEDGNLQLLVAAQISKADINAIMNESSGLGETGESYLIGSDFLGRSDSRFLADIGVESTILNPDLAVDTAASRAGVAGETGQGTITDYRGLPVLSSWAPIVIHEPDEHHPEGITWAMLTEIDEAEALEPVNQLAGLLGLVIALSVLGIGALAVFLGTRFANEFVTPILNLTDRATEVAAGNLDLRFESDREDELGTLSNTFTDMTAQLQETLQGLEQRVADRTRALETSTEVSRRLSTILDQDQLAKTVVDELVSSFGYYYAHIYRFQEGDKNILHMQGGTGEAGQVLLARGHTIAKGRGLVGRAAETNSVVLVNDTLNEEGWLPNELLPETRSEIAVPIAIGDEVLGVFDVQHNVVDAFTEEDAGLLQSLANQVAIAAQNAQVYVEAQKRADREALIGDIGQKIQNAATVEDALQVAVRELGRALKAEHSSVQLNLQAKEDQQGNA